jgi:hypothetical protein
MRTASSLMLHPALWPTIPNARIPVLPTIAQRCLPAHWTVTEQPIRSLVEPRALCCAGSWPTTADHEGVESFDSAK